MLQEASITSGPTFGLQNNRTGWEQSADHPQADLMTMGAQDIHVLHLLEWHSWSVDPLNSPRGQAIDELQRTNVTIVHVLKVRWLQL